MSEVDDFLAHYGVKGMKWGVRKTEKNADFVVGKENPIYNISSNTPRDESGQVYAAFTKRDVINYRSMYVAQLRGFVGASTVFSNAFDLKSDLKVAGEKAQIEAFKELWEKDKEGIAKTLAASQVDISFVAAIINRGLKIDRTKAYEKRFMQASESYMMRRGFKQFQTALNLETNNFKTPYYSLLAKRGYSALLDMNDVRSFGGEKPILIFKGKDHLRNKNSVELTKTDIQLAMDTYFNPKDLDRYDIHDLHAKHEAEIADFIRHLVGKGEEVGRIGNVEDFLAHYGVKGMKWGKRKADAGASKDSQQSTAAREKAKGDKSGIKVLSNAELQAAINRMQLEQNFKRLAINERPPVQRWIASTLVEIGKREVQVAIGKKVAKTVAKKAVTGGAA